MHASLVEYFSAPIKYPNVTTKAGVGLGFKKPQKTRWFQENVGLVLGKSGVGFRQALRYNQRWVVFMCPLPN
jgi:hypothetical protein